MKKTIHIVVPKNKVKEIKKKSIDLSMPICSIYEEFAKKSLDNQYDLDSFWSMFEAGGHRMHLRVDDEAMEYIKRFKNRNKRALFKSNKKIGQSMILGAAFTLYLDCR